MGATCKIAFIGILFKSNLYRLTNQDEKQNDMKKYLTTKKYGARMAAG